MKKLIPLFFTLAAFAVFGGTAFATDVCSDTPLESADFYVETSRASWLMSQSCVDSGVLVTMPQGSVMHVIGKTEGWHKLVTEDGRTGWMWEDFVTSTNKTFNPVGSEPVPEPFVTHDPMYDIPGHKYEDAVWFLYNNGVVGGYPDGSFKADISINRAELLKIIIEAVYDNEFESYAGQNCFSDVPSGEWYTKYVCFAKQKGIVEGYSDATFKPSQEIVFVEALKIASVGFWGTYTEGSPWYKNIVDDAGMMNIIPLDINSFSEKLTRGQMAELITRIMRNEDNTLTDYLGDKGKYAVVYETIAAGINAEVLVGTGKCLAGDIIGEDGQSREFNEQMFTCTDSEWTPEIAQ